MSSTRKRSAAAVYVYKRHFADSALAPVGILVAIGYECGNMDEVRAFDASTLALRDRFGKSVVDGPAYGIAVVGTEVFIGHNDGRCVHAFSLDGTHLRTLPCDGWIHGRPKPLHHFDGRLYMTDQNHDKDTDTEALGGV